MRKIKINKDFNILKSEKDILKFNLDIIYPHGRINKGKLIPPKEGLTLIGKDVTLDITGNIILSNDTVIQDRVQIFTHTHHYRESKGRRKPLPVTFNNLFMEEDIFIGVSAIIINVEFIGKGAVIGAGAVITKNINPYEIWVGNPAKCIGVRGE